MQELRTQTITWIPMKEKMPLYPGNYIVSVKRKICPRISYATVKQYNTKTKSFFPEPARKRLEENLEVTAWAYMPNAYIANR